MSVYDKLKKILQLLNIKFPNYHKENLSRQDRDK